MALTDRADISRAVYGAVAAAKITDIHTHIYPPEFGELLLWGVDELVTYHYLIAETLRWKDIAYDDYWKMSRQDQADLIWNTLFLEHSPYSEACRGVLTVLNQLGLDTGSRDLNSYRDFFRGFTAERYVDRVFELSGVESVVMTNDPFDDLERPVWLEGRKKDPRFHAALRIDGLLNSWDSAWTRLKEWGYDVGSALEGRTLDEVRRFLHDWLKRTGALYMAASLPPGFMFPEDSPRGTLIAKCVLPTAEENNVPFAMMLGVKKLTNPGLRVGGDSVGKTDIDVVEHMCANYPGVRFLVTMLARENQHECAVAARKFRNLMVFGCWWFLNNPSLIDEITRMRSELLGVSFIPQHSDARVLDQLVYKWAHSRTIISGVLTDKYADLAATGWRISEEEITRDITDLFGGNFWRFVKGG